MGQVILMQAKRLCSVKLDCKLYHIETLFHKKCYHYHLTHIAHIAPSFRKVPFFGKDNSQISRIALMVLFYI